MILFNCGDNQLQNEILKETSFTIVGPYLVQKSLHHDEIIVTDIEASRRQSGATPLGHSIRLESRMAKGDGNHVIL